MKMRGVYEIKGKKYNNNDISMQITAHKLLVSCSARMTMPATEFHINLPAINHPMWGCRLCCLISLGLVSKGGNSLGGVLELSEFMLPYIHY